jgi:hypothetical protein
MQVGFGACGKFKEEHTMRRGVVALVFTFLGFLPAIAQQSSGETSTPAISSAFLPMIGQTAQYEYFDTVTTQKGNRTFTATLTLKSVTAKEIQATIEINGKESRRLDFYVDDTGTLQPTSMPEPETNSTSKRHGSEPSEQAAAVHAFVSRISLASRIGAQPTQETSFRVRITVPGASCALNPTLMLKPTQPDALVADADDTTSVSSPQKRRLFMPLGLGIGAGFIGGAIGGTPGRIVGISISATSLIVTLLRAGHSNPVLPADVSLHIDGKLTNSRLQALSGDQEVIVHGKHRRTISDKWSLVAGPAESVGL